MSLRGPIILIEDDKNDAEVVTEALGAIGVTNMITHFQSAEEAIGYLRVTGDKPFFILCDIKLPHLDGLTFRQRIMEDEFLKKKAIPFIFFTGYYSQSIINRAYELDVQGFYKKELSFERLREQLLTICLYWQQSMHPNSDGNENDAVS